MAKGSPEKEASPLRRFRLVIEFEGTNFRGWQKQGERSIRTVQGVLLERAAGLFPDRAVDIQGNGRTDAGVHALAYTAHLEAATHMAPEEIKAALNQALPGDVAVRELVPADPRFHARHHCCGRSYLYQIALVPGAFFRRYSWDLEAALDLTLMRQTAGFFAGMQDCAAFAEKQELKKSTQVLFNAVRVERVGAMLLVRVVASHFLWHLVRRMVGTLAAVGSGKMAKAEVEAMLASGQSSSIPWMAPAHGLFFEKAFYDPKALAAFVESEPLLPVPRSG